VTVAASLVLGLVMMGMGLTLSGLVVGLGMAFLFWTLFNQGLYLFGMALLIVLMSQVSLALRQEKPRGRFVLGAVMAVLWCLPLGLAGLWLAGIPPVVYDNCTACKCNLRNLGTAVELYYSEHGKKFPSNLDQLLPEYVHSLPVCPSDVAHSPETRVFYRRLGMELSDGYGYRRMGDGYVLWCRTRGTSGHKREQQPWYSSVAGSHDECWFDPNLKDARSPLGAGPPDELAGKASP